MQGSWQEEPIAIRTSSRFEPHLIPEYTNSECDFAVFASMQSAWRQVIEMRLDVVTPPLVQVVISDNTRTIPKSS
jgi:hypothetical protein